MEYFRAAEPVLTSGPQDRDLAALYDGMAGCYLYSGPCTETLEYSWRAMELASRLGEEVIWTRAAGLHGYALVVHCGEMDRGLRLMQEATDAANRSGRPEIYIGVLVTALAEFGCLEDPVSAQQRIVNWLERIGEPPGSYLHGFLGAIAGEAAVIAGDLTVSRGGNMSFIPRALAGIWLGDWAESESFLHGWDGWAHANGSQFNRLFAAHWSGRLHVTSGNYEAAIGAFTRALELADEGCTGVEMRDRPGLAVAYAAQGRLDEARAEVDRCREIMALGEDWRGAAGCVILADAVLAAAGRRMEDAEGLLEQAIEILRRYQLPWNEADGLLLWAELLSAHGHRYRAPALERVDAAIDIYTRHGAGQPLIDRALAIRQGIAGDSARAGAYPDGLTAREVEVLRLIAAGRSDREIAEQLVLSVRTVGRHVTNVYNKIGAHSRADATAYAIRHAIA
jgi:DNA-binding CsgD family transcriptional regulator